MEDDVVTEQERIDLLLGNKAEWLQLANLPKLTA